MIGIVSMSSAVKSTKRTVDSARLASETSVFSLRSSGESAGRARPFVCAHERAFGLKKRLKEKHPS
jgi:hypothetical protein